MSPKKIVIFTFVLLLIAFLALLLKYKNLFYNPLGSSIVAGMSYKETEIKINSQVINVQISDSPQKWSQGLSDRKSMREDSGMLFVFPQKSPQTFWMKDMFFPLDFVWIDDGKIVKIDENVQNPSPGTPENKLTLYNSDQPINYVLEVNAGFVAKNNIKVGDTVDLSKLGN